MLRLFLCWAVVAVAACGGPSDVAVRVLIPGPDSQIAPVASLPIIALPYDRDSVLATMAANAARPRPHTEALDSLFASYREPFAAFAIATHAAEQLRDSLDLIKRTLDTLQRSAPRYDSLYARFTRTSDSTAAADRRRAAAERALAQARTRLAPRIDSLRATIRAWEDSTFRGYDTVVQHIAESKFRLPVSDTTNAAGWATVRLDPGQWWIYVRSWDAHDPNREWYWNLPVTGDTVTLSPSNGQRRPKY